MFLFTSGGQRGVPPGGAIPNESKTLPGRVTRGFRGDKSTVVRQY